MSMTTFEWCEQPALKRIWQIFGVRVEAHWHENVCLYQVFDEEGLLEWRATPLGLATVRAEIMRSVLNGWPR